MRILLIRHAQAVETAKTDEERWLTPKGRELMYGVVAKLEEMKIRPAKIFTSSLVRAVQTAEILATLDHFDGPVEVRHALAPEKASPNSMMPLLGSAGDRDTIALVGHEPSISAFAGDLLDVKKFPSFRKGAVCSIRRREDGNELDWMLNPKTLDLVESIDDLEP